MNFHNSCSSAVRNKNFEWTALSGISTIIGSCKDVYLLLSVWLILRKHRARRAKPSEPVHSARCLAQTLSMDSVVLVQNSYRSLFHVCWVGNKAPNLYLQFCLLIILASHIESQKYCTALLSPFICCCRRCFCFCCNISKSKVSWWFKLLEYVLHYFVHNDALTIEWPLVIVCDSRYNNYKLCNNLYCLFMCIPIIPTINSDYLVFHR